MDQAIESVVINIQWMKENFDMVVEWLEENRSGGVTSNPNDVRLPTHLHPISYKVEVSLKA